MITIMKTSTFLNAIDDAYAKGVAAGANAERANGNNEWYSIGKETGIMEQKLSDHEDQNRRLGDMLQHGKALGRAEAYAELGAIEIEELGEDLDPSVFDEEEA